MDTFIPETLNTLFSEICSWEIYCSLPTPLHDNQMCVDFSVDTLRLYLVTCVVNFSRFMLNMLFLSISIGWMQHNMRIIYNSCGAFHCIVLFSPFSMTPSSSTRLLPKEVLWPFRFPWYRTQVTKAMGKKKPIGKIAHKIGHK